MIRLNTIGPIAVHIGDRAVPASQHQLIAALFHLVVERGKPVSRRSLAEMFYPGFEPDAAAHACRQLVYRLRKLGATVGGDAVSVILKADTAAWDVEIMLARGIATETELGALQHGYLPDYTYSPSEEFVRWVDAHRNHVSHKLRQVLIEQIHSTRARQDFRGLEPVARACLALDPLNEEATLACAESLAMTGAKARALAILEDYAADVGRHSNALTLAPQLLRERISEYLRPDTRVYEPLVGRDTEINAIGSMLAQVALGAARACVVTGPPGIGKTRLLKEACSLAALAGHATIRTQLNEHDARRPFAILRDVGGALLDLPGSLGASTDAIRAIRGLCGRGPSVYTVYPENKLDSRAINTSLHAHVIELVDAVAEEQPLTICIDDAQWIDRASLDLLAAIINDRRQVALLLGSRQRVVLDTPSAPNPAFTQLALPSLRRHDSTALLHELFLQHGRAPDNDFIEFAVRSSAGVPFYLRLLYQHFLETNDPRALPETLAESISARIASLNEPARGVFDAIVVLGVEASEDCLHRVCQLPRHALIGALRSLESSGLVTSASDGVRVSHDFFAVAGRDNMPPSVARLLHRAAAETLEYKSTEVLRLAMHWEMCGEPQKALRALVMSAKASTRLGQPAEAVDALQKAKTLARGAVEQREVDSALLFAFRASGEHRRGVEVAERLGLFTGHGSPEERLIAHEMLSASGGLLDKTIGVFEEFSGDRTLSPETRAEAAAFLIDYSEDVGSKAIADQAIRSIADLKDNLPSTLYARVIYDAVYGSASSAISRATKLFAAAQALPLGSMKLRSIRAAALACYRCGQNQGAFTYLTDGYQTAKAAHVWSFCVSYASLLSYLHWSEGNLRSAQDWHSVAVDDGRPTNATDGVLHFWGVSILVSLETGDHEAALAFLNGAEALFPRALHDRMGLDRVAFKVRIELYAGRQPRDKDIEELLQGHLLRRGDGQHDLVADTLFGALTSCNREDVASQLRGEYASLRRDRFPIAKPFSNLFV
jgi:DNA-binding SARP family transcriptional activator